MNIYRCAKNDRADMVRGRKLFEQVENRRGKIVKMRKDVTEVHFNTPFHAKTLAEEPKIVFSRHFFNWLYRRDFLEENEIRFLTTVREERPFLLKALLSAKAISGIDSQGLVYRIRQDSETRRDQTVSDAVSQLSTFESVIDLLKQSGAFKKDNELNYVAVFQVSQFLHYLFIGAAYKTIRARGSVEEIYEFFHKLKQALRRTGMSANDLVEDPMQLSEKHIQKGAGGCLLL